MINQKRVEKAIKEIIISIGENPNRSGLKGTPSRVARMYAEIFNGKHEDPLKVLKVHHEEEHEEMVIVKDIPLYSVCEHHLLPFIGKAHVAYIPTKGRITGLSKIARVVDIFSRRLQVQERMTSQIADILMKGVKPKGVFVIIEAEHLCMSMRGIKKPGHLTITSAVRGIFQNNNITRQEALALINSSRS